MTKSELKEIIKECILEESCIQTKYIYNGKQILIPLKLKNEMDKCYKEITKFIDDMQSQQEYKDIINTLIENKIINSSCKDKKLYSDSHYEIIDVDLDKEGNISKIKASIVITAYWMTQDAFYYEYDAGKLLGKYTDKYFNKIKDNKKIISNKYFYDIYNGDDFWGWDIYFKFEQ